MRVCLHSSPPCQVMVLDLDDRHIISHFQLCYPSTRYHFGQRGHTLLANHHLPQQQQEQFTSAPIPALHVARTLCRTAWLTKEPCGSAGSTPAAPASGPGATSSSGMKPIESNSSVSARC